MILSSEKRIKKEKYTEKNSTSKEVFMKLKNKFAAVSVAAVIAAALAGCGGSSGSQASGSSSSQASGSSSQTSVLSGVSENANGTSASSAASAGSGSYRISMIVKNTDEHFQRVKAGAEAYCAEHPGVTVDFMAPTSQTAYDEQNNAVETALATSDYSGYIIAPLQSDSVATLCQNATKPVVAVDTDFDSDKKASFVGTGNEKATKEGAMEAVRQVQAAGVKKPTAAIITGSQGDPTHDARLAGYREGVEEAGGEVIDVQYTDMSPDQAALCMEGLMQKYPNGIDIVFSTSDQYAMAASKVISDANSEAFNKTLQCGFDGTSASTNAVKSGTMQMDIAQNGYDMGYKAMDTVMRAIRGEQVESFIDSGYTLVTSDTVDDYIEKLKETGSYTES